VVESVLCQKGDGGWNFRYQAVIFFNGSVLVNCSIADGNGTSSASTYYEASQQGGLTRSCLVAHDAEQDGGSGWWQFSLAAGGAYRALYHDVGSVLDGDVVAFDGPSASGGGCDVYAD
jgi:hypothetical protein